MWMKYLFVSTGEVQDARKGVHVSCNQNEVYWLFLTGDVYFKVLFSNYLEILHLNRLKRNFKHISFVTVT